MPAVYYERLRRPALQALEVIEPCGSFRWRTGNSTQSFGVSTPYIADMAVARTTNRLSLSLNGCHLLPRGVMPSQSALYWQVRQAGCSRGIASVLSARHIEAKLT